MNKIKNKIALVTGASSGIGKETVKKLLLEGATVYAAARRMDKMEDLATLGSNLIMLDITKDESVVNCVNTIIKQHGRIDILINNAGYGSYGALEDVKIEEARRQFEVNLFGLGRLTQLVLPYMRNNKFGKIVNITSMGGKVYMPMGGWYHATKHALEGWSDCLRLEVKQFGIDVIIIEPGGIYTEWQDFALNSAIENSGQTAYKNIATNFKKVMLDTYQEGKASHPSVISNLIFKALSQNKPKARYRAGYMAKLAIFSRWLLSDAMFDKFMKFQLGL